jgi:glucan phosphoethanolaminetransferase (alkaline phosphatase superfamily)
MELDDLKNIWNKRDTFQPKLEEEIASMLKGKSNSIIAKLKRNIWVELIFTSIASIILLYYSFTIPNGALKWSFVSFLLLYAGYILYYIKQLNVFRQFRTSDENLRTNLENLVHDLDKYLKFYRMSYSLLYPVFFILMLIFVIMDRGMHDFLEAIQETKMIICLILVIGIFLASSLWFTNWYLKKLYGNHVEKLKLLLKDISELGDEIA